jgi:hypothetical protein
VANDLEKISNGRGEGEGGVGSPSEKSIEKSEGKTGGLYSTALPANSSPASASIA